MILQQPFAIGSTISGTYTRTLTIDHTQVPSTQTDFPIVVNFTNTTFKTIANGGHVFTTNAFTFSSDSGGASLLKWEVERYNASTGEIVAWVKIASVSSASDTVFYLRYGTSITTDQSDAANVWTNSFVSVYHLKDGTTLSLVDSVGNNNGTGSNTPTATTGNIDGGMNLTASSSQSVGLGSGATLNISGAITMSAWVNMTSFPTSGSLMAIISKDFVGGNKVSYFIDIFNNAGTLQLRVGRYDGSNHTTAWSITGWSTGAWHLIHGSWKSSDNAWHNYFDGVDKGSTGPDVTGAASGSDAVSIGNTVNLTRYLDGKGDEVRISNVTRSDDWITVEYANQNSSTTLVALGSET